MNRFRLALAAAALLATPLSASADIVGFDFGAYGWRASAEGYLQDNGTRADVEDELGLDSSETNTVIWAALEHPLPVLPNLKLQYTPMEFSGSGRLDNSISFDGIDFIGSERVDTDLTMDQLDVILYYEVLDNIVDLDLGLNFKVIDGEITIVGRTSGERYQEDLPGVVPMVYLNAGVNLPITNLSLGLEASGIAYSGDRYTDIKASLGYQVAVLKLEAGYRLQQLVVDDLDGADVDVEVGGPFVGAALKF